MRYSIAALALAGAAFAMPSKIARDQVVDDVQVVEQVQWVTDVVTVVGPAPTGSPDPAPAPAAPEVQAAPAAPAAPVAPVAHVQAAPSPPAPTTFVQVTTPAPVASPSPAPAASSSNSGSSNSDSNSSDAILAVANKWRKLYPNLSTYTWSDELASNAGKTGSDDKGTNENHELNTISLAQVITPGINTCSGKASCSGLSSGFELAYIAGWLCEAPQLPLTKSMCDTYKSAAGINNDAGETGHADILTSKAYTKIGCAFSGNGQQASDAQWTGLWICDLA